MVSQDKEHDSRTALRLPNEQRKRIEELVEADKFKNISSVIRQALKDLLEKEVSEHG
jgi:Arc/MetJ-type ribon-helix-helix transcriptional regulator